MFRQKKASILTALILCLPLLFYSWCIASRPPRSNFQQEIIQGINYQRIIQTKPRPYIVHVASVDLTTPHLEIRVTAPISGQDARARVTSSVVKDDLLLGVNGSFFYPFEDNTPWNYYPHQDEQVIALGESIDSGHRYGKVESQWNVICFDQQNKATIPLHQSCPDGTMNGIAGRELLVQNGNSVIDYETKAYARTAVGINRAGTKIWLILVDGKQPFYSEGATLAELAQIAVDLGSDRAINLDGGGSSTLAIARRNQLPRVKVMNSPIHTKIPMRERPVANHLGFTINLSAIDF